MNALLLSQFFPPEPCAASNRNAAIAAALLSTGHDVQVVTGFPNFPSGVIPERYRRLLRTAELVEGVRVSRAWTFASPRRSSLLRLLNWLSLSASASLHVLFLRGRYDVVYVSSPPITLALPAIVASLRHRARLVVDVRDSYPEVAVRMGMWKPDSLLARAVGWVARTLYHRAAGVIGVTESMREEIEARGCDPGKILIAPNGFDRIEPSPEAPYARREGEVVAAFVGNFGLAAGVDVVVDAAALLRDEPHVRFVLVGDGSEFQRIRDRVAAQGLTNVELLGARPRTEAMAALRDADVCIVPLKRHLVDSLPTKLFDALSVGCPVLVSAAGEARHFVERSGGGWCVPPEDPPALAAAIREIAAAPRERLERAERGRVYVERHYDRARSMTSIVNYMESLVDPMRTLCAQIVHRVEV
ncbi:MAG: glycosyltransferase family 4 protein [bacterium]|nr:glycosyltransferase family 4 protein [bacterium]